MLPEALLKKAIEKKDLSQRALVKLLGGSWTEPKLNDILSGKRGITVKTALDLEEILGLPAEKLLKCQMDRRLWEERNKRKN